MVRRAGSLGELRVEDGDDVVSSFLAWPPSGQKVLGQSRLATLKPVLSVLPPAVSLAARQGFTQPP